MNNLVIYYILHYNSNALCGKEAATILNTDGTKPIYVQIAEWIETEIMNGHFESDQKVYSQYQLAEMYTINPATAAKGLNLLVDENILYKKRGLGMFVSTNAKEMIINKRKNQTLKRLVHEIVLEANRLQMSDRELIDMIKAVQIEEGER
ncbi:DNA-binding transcriptional regulator YhcF (GntR family) [Cytobacillus eiseniae]|uniref:DNA-binding transcriptional regulator YhcF (GntR family) n=1 Tax=Cytobacillus eiseniae TaxID=762947 RepID=A0ABS4RKB2_9BACI|nr:GntR family transcriptional regulator [Cytobacillus eiseniae]MBP2243306.1 DNA-binding transcriptional regulator YhcF (GntR family) [Cytobacillus eiseniae]